MPSVAVVIVTWNSKTVVADCLSSLQRQTFGEVAVMVVDNASSDGTVELIRRDFPQVMVLRNPQNVGFARANNQGIALTQGDYVLTLNPDVELEPTFLERLVKFAQAHPQGGAYCGKLLKRQPEQGPGVIDSTGVRITRSRRVLDRGEGEIDAGRYETVEQVFGVTGAAALYRRAALHEAVVDGQYFDEFFFAYKEDVDLAWRLRLLGWEAWYVPMAVGYHPRGLARLAGWRGWWRRRRQRSRALRLLSYRNHRALLLKHEQLPNLLLHAMPIAVRELGSLTFVLLVEPFQLKGIGQLVGRLPRLLGQRRELLQRRRVTAREIRKWFR